MLLHRAILVLLLSWATSLPAATALIALEHRTAEDLLPAAQALLNEGEVLVADGNQLVLRASLERINELRGILNQLDTPARQLLISLDNGATPMPRYRTREPASATPHPAPRVITAGRSDLLRIRASEGQPAFFELARSEPALGFSADPHRAPYLHDSERESGVSLYLVAHLLGDGQVHLEIGSRRSVADSFHPGARDILQSETRLSGRLGEWIEVAGAGDFAERAGLAAGGERSHPLRLRVEAID